MYEKTNNVLIDYVCGELVSVVMVSLSDIWSKLDFASFSILYSLTEGS